MQSLNGFKSVLNVDESMQAHFQLLHKNKKRCNILLPFKQNLYLSIHTNDICSSSYAPPIRDLNEEISSQIKSNVFMVTSRYWWYSVGE